MPEERHTPTIDELIELPEPSDAQISPDGTRVAYVVSTPDWKENRHVSQIWLADATVDPPQPRQLTFSKYSSWSPRWSPDGQWLAFLSDREDDKHTQIYRLSSLGGEAERLTEAETEIELLAWSPDGKSIAYVAEDAESEEQKQRKEKHGDYHIEDHDYTRSHLWSLNVEDKKMRKLTHGESFHLTGFDWSPDSRRIVFAAMPTSDVRDWDRARIYRLDLATLGVMTLTEEGCLSPRWSPDGAHIAFARRGTPTYYANGRICVIPADGGEVPGGDVVPMDFDEDPDIEDWGPDGIYFGALQRTQAHLFRVDPGSGAVARLTPDRPEGWISFGGSFSRNFRRASLIAGDAVQLAEAGVLTLADSTFRQLTDFNTKVKDWSLSQPEVFSWTSLDGTPIEGVLIRPSDFEPGKKYPLLVVIHGGPSWASFRLLLSGADRRYYPMQLWAAKGAFILQPNYRGSAGYGEAFRALNVRNLGIGDYEDVISGVDALIARGWVDPDRVGAMGWSQGGYISAFITTYSSRFKAVSVGAGISNWTTYYVNTDVHPFTRQYLEATPWDDEGIYRRTSPMTYIKQAQTPTLIQHGEFDRRVPIPNAYELYQGLQDVGVEAKLVVYKGMAHGISRPRLNRQVMQENLDWFNRWIWGETPAPETKPACYVALSSAEQREDEGELPAIERFTASRVQDVYHWARRDGVEFRILSGRLGLIRATDSVARDEHALSAEDVSTLARRVAEQMTAGGFGKVVVHTGDPKKDASVLIGVGCLQVAAGIAGEVTVEHREVSEEGW